MTENEVAALRADIARTRADLGDTVEELAGRVDVKARAKEAVDEAKHRSSLAVAQVRDRAAQFGKELRADPAATAKRTANRIGGSVRSRPRAWAVSAAALVAVALLVARRRGNR